MADTTSLSREYTIPLRRFWKNVQQYNRTAKAVKTIKTYVAKHMKVTDRNVDNVKLDVYFNNELWFRGRANPPAKITVKATKEGDIVNVSFVKEPQQVTFAKARHARMHKPAEQKKDEAKAEAKTEQTPEQKKDEQEKEQATAQAKQATIKQDNKSQQKATKIDKAQHPQRMALKK